MRISTYPITISHINPPIFSITKKGACTVWQKNSLENEIKTVSRFFQVHWRSSFKIYSVLNSFIPCFGGMFLITFASLDTKLSFVDMLCFGSLLGLAFVWICCLLSKLLQILRSTARLVLFGRLDCMLHAISRLLSQRIVTKSSPRISDRICGVKMVFLLSPDQWELRLYWK